MSSKKSDSQSVKKTESAFKRLDLSKENSSKEEIKVLHDGPLYICDFCHSLLLVPDKFLVDSEIEEEDEDGSFIVIETSFDCIKCGERNVISEDEIEEEEEEQPKKSSSSKSKDHNSSSKSKERR